MSFEVERLDVPVSENSLDHNPNVDAELNKAKIMGDLRQGFRISFLGGEDITSYVTVITRNEDDLFEVYADGSSLSANDAERGFTRYACEVRRRKLLPPQVGSATLEVWKTSVTTRDPQTERFRIQTDKGGKLAQEAFWERYHGSHVDHDLTAEHLKSEAERELKRVTGIQGIEIRINWVADEREEAENDALSSETNHLLAEGR